MFVKIINGHFYFSKIKTIFAFNNMGTSMKLGINKNTALNFNKTMRYRLIFHQIKMVNVIESINYISIFKR